MLINSFVRLHIHEQVPALFALIIETLALIDQVKLIPGLVPTGKLLGVVFVTVLLLMLILFPSTK